jgi:hypothetical protein
MVTDPNSRPLEQLGDGRATGPRDEIGTAPLYFY